MNKCISLILSAVFAISVFAVIPEVLSYADNGEEILTPNSGITVSTSGISRYSTTTKTVSVNLDNLEFNKNIEFDIAAEENGNYKMGVGYYASDTSMDNLKLGVMVDGAYPFSDTEAIEFPRMWHDSGERRTDANGNEFAAEQITCDKAYINFARNSSDDGGEYYYLALTAGKHKITLVPVEGKYILTSFVLGATAQAENYKAPDTSEYYDGDAIIIEGEDATAKSSYFLVGKTDTSSVNITPNSFSHNVVNYIGGGNWKRIGDKIIWETPELEAGYYQLGFSFRQNSLIGGKTYRTLQIDGQEPFSEASVIGFTYSDSWQQSIYKDENNNPYLIYFSAGVHEISLEVSAGDVAPVREKLTDAVKLLSELYVDITMITGENVDIYRDYNLFLQIGDMEQRLETIKTELSEAADLLVEATGQKSGSNYSVIKNMIEVINQMLKNRYDAHRYKSYYYSNYCSVSSVLQDLRNMPLDLDKIVLSSPYDNKPFKKAGFFETGKFSIMRFLTSFVRNYDSVSSTDDDDGITIWVNWGRDQAQVLSSLVDRSFTTNTGISVKVRLVNASIIQAILSGSGPDCILQHSRSEPVNLAMRGVLTDLSQFDDLDNVLTRFQNGADTPYRYKGGLYALPDTQTYYMMFYRKDILDQLGIKVPETWDEFKEISKILMRNNMSVWLPNSPATDSSQVNAGVGSNNIFPSLIQQNGLSLYTEDGKKTTMLSSDVMSVFEEWTNYYTKLKFPVTLSFYTRFRTGTTPIGIAAYNFYTTIKVAAPEIDGLWDMTAIPGTLQDDGTVCHSSSGGGTGCAILENSKHKNEAWEFLKWWTDSDTQLVYSNDIESVLGPSGRVALSNIEAIKGLSWDYSMLDSILDAWSEVKEIPEYPGSYYVSRSIYQSFWNVVNDNQNTKDMLMEYGTEADEEIARKWKQYSDK